MTTRIINGSLYRLLEEGELLARGDVFCRDGAWLGTAAGGKFAYRSHPLRYWRKLEEAAPAGNVITAETTYSLTDPCCDALAADVSGGLFTIIDGLLSLEVGAQLIHIAFCPFCGTEINS